VAVAGSYAYVSAWDVGLVIMDISNPASPTTSFWYDTPTDAYDIAVAGDYAFVADFEDGLYSIDISDPAHPVEADLYFVPEEVTYALAISGTLAYVAIGYDGMRIVDISDPRNLVQVSWLTIPGTERVLDLAVAGSYAYLAASATGLHVIDVSNPAAPVKVTTLDTNHADGVTVRGRYLYLSDRQAGLRIIDVINPAAPTEVGSYIHTPFWLYSTVVNYPYAYLGIGDVLDVSNPISPTLVGSFTSQASVYHMALDGDTLYVPRFDKGLSVMDLAADPANPALAFTYLTGGYAMGVDVVGDDVYVADGRGGLLVLRASTTTTPYQVFLPVVYR
jgi:hypothetical protein